MKLDEARIVLRPRSVAELLDLGLRFMAGARPSLYAKLGLFVLVPAWGLCLAARYALAWDWELVWLLALGLATITQGVFTVAAGRLMFAESVSVREVLGQTLKRAPAYLGALILTRLMIGLAGLLVVLVIPPLWVWARYAHVHEACLLEQAGPMDAVNRAGRMVKGNFMGVLGLLLGLSGAAGAFVLSTESLVNTGLLDFVLQVGLPFGSLLDEGGSAAALLGLFVAVPYWATTRFLAYIDLRTRRDGWDVQLRFMAIVAKAEADAEADAELGPSGRDAA